MSRVQHQRPSGVLPAVLCWSGVALLVASCSSSSGTTDPTGINTASVTSTDPSSTASSTPKQTPTPTPTYKPASAEGPAENVPLPVVPEAAKVKSKEGLEAFAGYWYQLLNYGYETGDVTPLKAVTEPSAFAAKSYYLAVEDGYVGADWMGGAQVSIISVMSSYILTPNDRYQVVIIFEQDDLEYYSSEGTVEVITPTVNPGKMLMEATYRDGWRADQVVSLRE